MLDRIEGFVANPATGLAFACLLVVIAWKINMRWANLLLFLALLFVSVSLYRAWPAEWFVIRKVLVTTLCASVVGLLLYETLWTRSPTPPLEGHKSAPTIPSADEIAERVAKRLQTHPAPVASPAASIAADVRIKIVEPLQYLPDDKGGVYVVIPDLHLMNRGDAAGIASVGLGVERETGVIVHFEASGGRIPAIETWLANNHISNPHFLGRQMNVPPGTGINGYMAFYVDKTRLAMSMMTREELRAKRIRFELEVAGQKPRSIPFGLALMGKD